MVYYVSLKKVRCYMRISPETLKKIRKIIFNKYAIVLIIFVLVLTFNGSYSLINRIKRGMEINSTKKEIKFYKTEIETNIKQMKEMRSSDKNLEKFAREKYYLKKDSEDIYIIKEDDDIK